MVGVRPALVPLALVLSGVAATGEAAAQTSVPDAVSVDAAVTLTSDYRFRGLSQTDREPAVQASASVTHRSGVYAGLWASTISRYPVDGAQVEVDLYGGIRKSIGGTTLDAGLLYYGYPRTGRQHGDSFESYAILAHTLGPVTARTGVDYAWKQSALALGDGRKRAGLYGFGELSAGIPTTPLTVTGRVGRSFRATYATLGQHYTDWSLQVGYVRKALTLSVGYVDTDKDLRSYPDGRPRRDVSGAGVVGSVALAF